MKGLEHAKKYYEEFGKPMIERDFPQYIDRIAVGLVGHGSECFGYDDEISRDHDFEPGFTMWITEEDEKIFGFKLFRAYSKLPKEYMGVKIQNTSALGSKTKGVHTISEFYSYYLPDSKIPSSTNEWLNIPDFYLAEAINGEVFSDPLGEFSRIRNEIKYNYPRDARLNKLASAVFNMAQSGQYNYSRIYNHGEHASASIALNKFAENAAHAAYLLNSSFMPYYKWAIRGIKDLPRLSIVYDLLTELLKEPYNKNRTEELIESISITIGDEIREQGLSDRKESYLEGYAYCVKNNISDGVLRNSPIM